MKVLPVVPALILLALATSTFAADADHHVALFREAGFAVRFAKNTFVPVALYRPPADKPIYRPGARETVVVYEDFSAVNMIQGSEGPARVAIACYPPAVRPDAPFGDAYRRETDVARVPADPAVFARDFGLDAASAREVHGLVRFAATARKEGHRFDVWAFRAGGVTFVTGRKGGSPEKLDVKLRLQGLGTVHPSIDLSDPGLAFYRW